MDNCLVTCHFKISQARKQTKNKNNYGALSQDIILRLQKYHSSDSKDMEDIPSRILHLQKFPFHERLSCIKANTLSPFLLSQFVLGHHWEDFTSTDTISTIPGIIPFLEALEHL